MFCVWFLKMLFGLVGVEEIVGLELVELLLKVIDGICI